MDALNKIAKEVIPFHTEGHVVDYIPILKNIDTGIFSVTILDKAGNCYEYGNQDFLFSMQSISKIVNFIVATCHLGLRDILNYVDLEPTGDPFNSIIRLESSERGKPFNPLINAGAITIASLLPGASIQEKINSVLTFLEDVTGVKCEVNEEIFASEQAHSYRNRAIAYYLKEGGYLKGDADDALEVYLKLCSVEVSTSVVAAIGLLIANDGIHPQTDKKLVESDIIKVVKALMVTCGLYNSSGRYAAFIGIPSKSGVSGGILCALSFGEIEQLKGPIGMGVFSPVIDEVGNSVVGLKFLQKLSQAYDLSIF